MKLLIEGLETPLIVVLLGVILAIASPLITMFTNDCNVLDTVSNLLDISQLLISGGLGGAVFRPLKR